MSYKRERVLNIIRDAWQGQIFLRDLVYKVSSLKNKYT